MNMNLKEQTLDLLTRLLEGNMVSVKGDEMIQEFISTKLLQSTTPEVNPQTLSNAIFWATAQRGWFHEKDVLDILSKYTIITK